MEVSIQPILYGAVEHIEQLIGRPLEEAWQPVHPEIARDDFKKTEREGWILLFSRRRAISLGADPVSEWLGDGLPLGEWRIVSQKVRAGRMDLVEVARFGGAICSSHAYDPPGETRRHDHRDLCPLCESLPPDRPRNRP